MARPRNDSPLARARAEATGKRAKESRETSRHDAAAPPGVPECPAHVTGEAREIWDRTISLMIQIPRLLSIVDGDTIALYCGVSADLLRITRGMNAKVALVIRTAKIEAEELKAQLLKDGHKADARAISLQAAADIAEADVVKEYANTLEKLRMRQNSLAREIGLTCASRSQIKVEAPGFVPKTGPIAAHMPDDDFFGASELKRLT